MIGRALAKYLDARSLVAYRPDGGGDCFVERGFPDEPDDAVRILSTGGNPLPAAATFGYDEPTLQLMTRGAVDDSEAPLAWAWSLYGALQGLRYVVLDEGGPDEVFLVVCSFAQTGPVNIGTDEKGRHRFTLNPALHVRALTEHRD